MEHRATRSMTETDVFTGWRHYLAYLHRPGVKSAVKRGARRRERREGKHAIRRDQGNT